IESIEEGIIALDRIRIWLHLLLALSSNSPYWNGKETSFASYRYQVWSRWPTSGPTEIFGSAKNYAAQRQAQLNTQVPLDAGIDRIYRRRHHSLGPNSHLVAPSVGPE